MGPSGRVVSLSPAVTEILFHIGAQTQIVGRTDNCDFPAAVQDIPSVGSLFPPNLEMILRTKPDVVVMMEGSLQLKEKLLELNIPVFVTQTQSILGIAQQMRQLGILTGRETVAEQQAIIFESKIRKFRQKQRKPKPKIYWEIWQTPLMTVGRESFVHDLIHAAGGVNVFGDQTSAWPTVTAEAVIRRQPQIVFTIDREEFLKGRSTWFRLLNLKYDRLIQIDNPDILHRPSPRVVNGLNWIHRKLNERK